MFELKNSREIQPIQYIFFRFCKKKFKMFLYFVGFTDEEVEFSGILFETCIFRGNFKFGQFDRIADKILRGAKTGLIADVFCYNKLWKTSINQMQNCNGKRY